MEFSKNNIIILAVIGGIVLVAGIFIAGLLLKGGDDPYAVKTTLTAWGIQDTRTAYASAFERFKTIYPNVTIQYRSFSDPELYDQTLLEALAAGEGPDLFMIRNDDLPRKANKLFPVPAEKYSLRELRTEFPDVVEDDFTLNSSVYALPLSVDSLALVYNKKLFNEEAVVFPPETWGDVLEIVPQLTEYDEDGRITRPAIGLGGVDNIAHAADILSALLLQSGVAMVNEDYTEAAFNTSEAANVLAFYNQFADEDAAVYTWDSYLGDAYALFSQGDLAMMIGYAKDIAGIRATNPFLETEVVSFPQSDTEEARTAYATYWGWGVSRQSKQLAIAWDLALHMTVNQTSAMDYMDATGNPPALLRLINTHLNDPDVGVFVRQALVASSWAKPDVFRVEEIFLDMMRSIQAGSATIKAGLDGAVGQISTLMQRQF